MARDAGQNGAGGSGAARRHIAHWRRTTARLQTLINAGGPPASLADEAHALQRQCLRLADDLGRVAAMARRDRQAGR